MTNACSGSVLMASAPPQAESSAVLISNVSIVSALKLINGIVLIVILFPCIVIFIMLHMCVKTVVVALQVNFVALRSVFSSIEQKLCHVKKLTFISIESVFYLIPHDFELFQLGQTNDSLA